MERIGFGVNSFSFETFGFGESGFDPITLFTSGKQGVWYDPSDKSTLFQDVAGTVPVTANGDPVGLMLDKSGNGNHATQALSAARPLYKTDGILHWLQFDGVDDSLKVIDYNLPSTGDFMSAISFSTNSPVRKENILLSQYDSSVGRFSVRLNAGGADIFLGGTNSSAFAVGLSDTISISRQSLGFKISNGVKTDALITSRAITDMALTISGLTSTSFFDGAFYGLVIISKTPDSSEGDLRRYLDNKRGY